MEAGIHYIVFHVGKNSGDPTLKSNLVLGFVQGNIFLVREALCVVLCDDISDVEVIRPPGLDGLRSCDEENIDTINPIRIIILTTTHVWGLNCSCRYIHFKIKKVISNVSLTTLKMFYCFIMSLFLSQQLLKSDKYYLLRESRNRHTHHDCYSFLMFIRCLTISILITW